MTNRIVFGLFCAAMSALFGLGWGIVLFMFLKVEAIGFGLFMFAVSFLVMLLMGKDD